MNNNKNVLQYTLLNNGWRIVSGPLILILIPTHLTAIDQGYWYLFFSLTTIFTIADMGVSQLVLQYTAQAARTVKFENGSISGDDEDKDTLSHIVTKTEQHLRIYGNLVFAIIFAIGFAFLVKNNNSDRYYIAAWTIYVIASYINFKNYYFSNFIEGLHFIKLSQRMKLVSSIASTAITALLLIFGVGIYSLSIGMLTSSLLLSLYYRRNFIRPIRNFAASHPSPLNLEVASFDTLSKRYIVSFISGYLIFNSFVPVSNLVVSPEFSGKVGLSLALAIAIFSLANSFIQVKIPSINSHIASNQVDRARTIFTKSLSIGVLFYLASAVTFVIIFAFLKHPAIDKLESRMLPLNALISLLACYGLQLFINSYATFVRAFNIEPFVTGSVILAIWVPISSFIATYSNHSEYIFTGWLASFAIWLPYTVYLYKQKNIR
jgi:hypothetical protein